jgi:hypothetical protein
VTWLWNIFRRQRRQRRLLRQLCTREANGKKKQEIDLRRALLRRVEKGMRK